ncbi:ABC transporter permease [Bacillus benzoevorans]|uniref:Putative spermidine/putrescine transport system permease protein n=1 Tax=Bacillus benzoevorans TaxID=1456 RepID=A0A7X0HU40_9BACI|nr:ABC transporter permease subunit [Bacillus benzoevorans]MBB6445596.1 putative spermidine/putrescine transport system permease protein [Bacillus benzoevorans]
MKNKTNLRYKWIVGFFLGILLLPLAVIIIWSFARNWPWPKIFPSDFGMRGWEYFIAPSSKSIQVLLFSLGLSFIVTLAVLVITIPAAKALALYQFRGKRLIEILTFAPIIVPTVAVAMGIHVQFIRMGLANTLIGVVLIHLIPCIPYTVRILKSVFELVGEKMELQARVLGAGKIQTYVYVTLPMILPGIISAGSMAFIVSFSQYFLTFLIGGGKIITFSMLMFPFVQSGDRMLGSVYSVVFILTAFIFLMIIEKLTSRFYKGKLGEYHYV